MKKLILFSPLMLIACATHRPASSPIAKSPHVIEMERKAKEREQARQDSEDMKRMLAQKRKQIGLSSSASSLRVSARPQDKKVVLAPVTGGSDDSIKISDRELFEELSATYDRNDSFGFHSRYQMFERKFASSPLMEDALYLSGLMAVSEKSYGMALKQFNRILDEHPHGHKASSALFAKGAVLKKMNLTAQAKQSWALVQKRYPGSPDAARAEVELKILAR
jgi:TolA-binding protein